MRRIGASGSVPIASDLRTIPFAISVEPSETDSKVASKFKSLTAAPARPLGAGFSATMIGSAGPELGDVNFVGGVGKAHHNRKDPARPFQARSNPALLRHRLQHLPPSRQRLQPCPWLRYHRLRRSRARSPRPRPLFQLMEPGEGAASAACGAAAPSSPNSAIRSLMRSNAALNTPLGPSDEICLAARFDGADLGVEQIAHSAVGADFPPPPCDFSEDPGAPADRSQIFLQGQAIKCRRRVGLCLVDRPPDGSQRVREPAFGSRLSLGGKTFLDPRHRIEHHAGIRIAIAPGILAEKPAAPRGLHESLADRVIVLLARLRGAGGNRR